MLLARNWKPVFLRALEHGNSVSTACRLAGVSRATAYRARQRSPKFAQEWHDAWESGTDLLEDTAFERALAGSDTLLIFLLKARRPEVFRENVRMEHDLGKELLDALNRAAEESAKAFSASSGRTSRDTP